MVTPLPVRPASCAAYALVSARCTSTAGCGSLPVGGGSGGGGAGSLIVLPELPPPQALRATSAATARARRAGRRHRRIGFIPFHYYGKTESPDTAAPHRPQPHMARTTLISRQPHH